MSAHPSDPAALHLGMIGGGLGAFIGPIHRAAAALDGEWRTVAGALSSTPERSRESGRAIGLAPARAYGDWREMLERESKLPRGERIDAVAIVTPNDRHAEPAIAFLNAGFHVILDKPMAISSAEAGAIASAAARAGVVCAVTYNYSGYPMARQAGVMVRAGAIGRIRRVLVEYHQGWLATALETSGQKQASWRTDPARAGAGGALGDIGTHAFHLLEAMTGLRARSALADVRTFVPGRRLDDDATVMLRLDGGGAATLSASQVCIGEENNLSIRLHGETGSLAWRQEEPNSLTLCTIDSARRILSRGAPGLDNAAQRATRLPPGHPEGFLEAFANVYRDIAHAIRAHTAGEPGAHAHVATVAAHEGSRGVAFIEACVRSAERGSTWVDLPA